MEKFKTIIMIVMMLVASCIITSCQSEEKKYRDMGITFAKIKDSSGYEFLSVYEGDDDNYVCNVDGSILKETNVSIPAAFKRKKVVAVTSTNTNATLQELTLSEGISYVSEGFGSFTALKTITFPKSLLAVYDSFKNCTALETLTFPGPVTKIGKSAFNDCTALKDIFFEDTIDLIENSFKRCPQLTKVILPAHTKIRLDPFSDETQILRGDRDIIAFSETYIHSEELKAQAMTHLAEEFGEHLKTTEKMIYRYRDQVNGPIVVTTRCPDCEYKDYGKDKLPKTQELSTVEVYTAQNDYPNTLYTKEKAEKIKNNEPIIYCFVEMIGYGIGPRYTFGGNNVGSYLHYRLSIWDASTDKLLNWCEISTGYAPYSFTYGKDTITFRVDFGENNTKSFFLESDKSEPTPLYIVEKFIFTTTLKKEESSSQN